MRFRVQFKGLNFGDVTTAVHRSSLPPRDTVKLGATRCLVVAMLEW
jgi:hypothetical protein